MFPSADVVAVAIYAAVRELVPTDRINEFSLSIAHGKKDVGKKEPFAGGFPFARIRIYAAIALWDAFPRGSRVGIARCVGQGYADVWGANVGKNLKAGAITWIDHAALARVRAAVAWAQKKTPRPSHCGSA